MQKDRIVDVISSVELNTEDKNVPVIIKTLINTIIKPKYIDNIYQIKTPFKPKKIFEMLKLDKEINQKHLCLISWIMISL